MYYKVFTFALDSMARKKFSSKSENILLNILKEKKVEPQTWTNIKINDPVIIEVVFKCYGTKNNKYRNNIKRVST